MKYQIHRSDTGSAEIRKGLERHGVDVWPIGRPVDLLCGHNGQNWLLELKAPKARARKNEAKQTAFITRWPGQVAVVRSLDEALRVLGIEQAARLEP